MESLKFCNEIISVLKRVQSNRTSFNLHMPLNTVDLNTKNDAISAAWDVYSPSGVNIN
jgi:hypothetical protein